MNCPICGTYLCFKVFGIGHRFYCQECRSFLFRLLLDPSGLRSCPKCGGEGKQKAFFCQRCKRWYCNGCGKYIKQIIIEE